MMWIYAIVICVAVASVSAQDRFLYVFSCTPRHTVADPSTSGCRVTIATGFFASTVRISTATGEEVVNLAVGDIITRDYNDMLPEGDGEVEPMGIVVGADEYIFVTMEKVSFDSYPNAYSDATEIFSIRGADDRQNFQQRVATFVTESLTCNSNSLKNFFTITAYKTSTVQIVLPGANMVQLILEPYDTYSMASEVIPVDDYTGYSIESDNYVSIISGSLCIFNPGNSFTNSAAFIQVPILSVVYEELDKNRFVVPNIGNILDFGYTVRVLALAPDTEVDILYYQRIILQPGEFRDFDFATKQSVTVVECSVYCHVTMLTHGNANQFGTFALTPSPVDLFYDKVFCTSLATDTIPYLSMVVTGIPPFDDILLDGVSIGNANWKQDANSFEFYFMWMEVSAGGHIIESSSGRTFAAYMYSHIGQRAGGYGFTCIAVETAAPLPTTTPEPPTTIDPGTTTTTEKPVTTTTTPGPDITTEEPTEPLPLINVRTSGILTSATTISPGCAGQYSSSMRTKANTQSKTIDAMIGVSLCVSLLDTVKHTTVTVSSSLVNPNQLDFLFFNVLEFGSGNNTKTDVVNCATEVGMYLNDHTNWIQPILPLEDGCDPVAFDPEEFPIIWNAWYCDGASSYDSDNTKNILTYDIVISDTFDVVGTPLDGDCVNAYAIDATLRTNVVAGATNQWMLGEDDCGDITVINKYSALFLSIPPTAYFKPTFQLIWTSPDTTTFNSFLKCMSAVTQYLRTHGSEGPWGDGGPIPPPDGCSSLEKTSSEFELNNRGWTCFDKP